MKIHRSQILIPLSLAAFLASCGNDDDSQTPTQAHKERNERSSSQLATETKRDDENVSPESDSERTEPYDFILSGSVNAVTGAYENAKLGIKIPDVTRDYNLQTHQDLADGIRQKAMNGRLHVDEEEIALALTAYIDTFLYLVRKDNGGRIEMRALDGEGIIAKEFLVENQPLFREMAERNPGMTVTDESELLEMNIGGKKYFGFDMIAEVVNSSGYVAKVGSSNFVTDHSGKIIFLIISYNATEQGEVAVQKILDTIESIKYN